MKQDKKELVKKVCICILMILLFYVSGYGVGYAIGYFLPKELAICAFVVFAILFIFSTVKLYKISKKDKH